ncbi:DUF1924 domain-containing protein [Ideonella sp.]|uniref:DUF1924 domain-containing protein n=1 Tax=Ideonella sp. TaxID=1929293 RepID=UPI0035AE3E90
MHTRSTALVLAVAAWASPGAARAADTRPGAQLARFATEAGRPGQADAGRAFFTRTHGGKWSCASCHREVPTQPGQHAVSGKTLEPLAPAANTRAFTEQARVDKWFRRNCKDVVGRECSAGEKADVLAYLVGLTR